MAIIGEPYAIAVNKAFSGLFDYENDTLKVMLLDDTYTPDYDSDESIDDITGEVTGTGYTAGGKTITNAIMVWDSANNRWKFDADDLEWATISVTCRYALIYDDTPTGTTNKFLVALHDFGEDIEPDADNLKLIWHPNGLFVINL